MINQKEAGLFLKKFFSYLLSHLSNPNREFICKYLNSKITFTKYQAISGRVEQRLRIFQTKNRRTLTKVISNPLEFNFMKNLSRRVLAISLSKANQVSFNLTHFDRLFAIDLDDLILDPFKQIICGINEYKLSKSGQPRQKLFPVQQSVILQVAEALNVPALVSHHDYEFTSFVCEPLNILAEKLTNNFADSIGLSLDKRDFDGVISLNQEQYISFRLFISNREESKQLSLPLAA